VTGSEAEVHAVMAWQVPFTIFIVPSYTEADYGRAAAETLTPCPVTVVCHSRR